MRHEMTKRIIRLADIATTKSKQGMLPVSPATVWRWTREGKFPKPYKLGKGVTVWNSDEVESFIDSAAREAAVKGGKHGS
jgi:predicted DNA-binding transcriptional regulator AlpA